MGGVNRLSSRAVIGMFYERLQTNRELSWVNKVSMHFGSDQASETYPWLGMSPQMREWIGPRLLKSLRSNEITIANKEFEASIEVALRDLDRDKTGQIRVRINDLADRAMSHVAKLLSDLIVAGGTGLAYDGQYFYDTDHKDVGAPYQTSQANDITFDISDLYGSHPEISGTAARPSAKCLQDAMLKGVETIMGIKDDQGEPFSELAREFVAMVPVAMMGPALGATSLPNLEFGQTNIITGNREFRITPYINPRLTSSSQIHVFRVDGATKPFIDQEERPVSIAAQAEGSPEEFYNKRHVYGVDRRGNVGYGMWQHACRVTIQD